MATAADFSVQDDAIDVNSYADRVKVLNMLSRAYEVPVWAPNPMDGDLIQTQWQAESARNGLPWWSRINYCLTIWRLQALQSAGEFGNVHLHGDLQVPLPPRVRRLLLRYYRVVLRFRNGVGPSPWMLQGLFWIVHSHTVTVAMRSAKELQSTLPNGERQFALGWGDVMVRVLAESNFSTAKVAIGPINKDCLPQRICNAGDIDPIGGSDLPPAQRDTVLAIAELYRWRFFSFLYLPFLELGATVLGWLIDAEERFDDARTALRRENVR